MSLDDACVRGRRRGASAAIIAVLLVPLCAVAALAIDASWWQVGRAQLQTTADAAALAGARALQVTANSQNRAAQVRAYARSMAAVDSAFSLPITLATTTSYRATTTRRTSRARATARSAPAMA
jgi:Flp pilus assembly protein TadG